MTDEMPIIAKGSLLGLVHDVIGESLYFTASASFLLTACKAKHAAQC